MTALGCSSYYQPRAQGTRLVTINITRRFFYLMHCHASQRRLIVNWAHWVTIHLVIIGSCVSGLPVIIRGSFDQHTSLFQGCLDESGTRPRLIWEVLPGLLLYRTVQVECRNLIWDANARASRHAVACKRFTCALEIGAVVANWLTSSQPVTASVRAGRIEYSSNQVRALESWRNRQCSRITTYPITLTVVAYVRGICREYAGRFYAAAVGRYNLTAALETRHRANSWRWCWLEYIYGIYSLWIQLWIYCSQKWTTNSKSSLGLSVLIPVDIVVAPCSYNRSP